MRKEKILVKIGSQKVHLIKLIGAFVVLGSAFMLLSDLYRLVSMASVLSGPSAQAITLNFYGLTLQKTVSDIGVGMQAGLMLLPLAGVMFWSAVLSFGAVLYRTGGITLPITERFQRIAEKGSNKDKEEEDNPQGRGRYVQAKSEDDYTCKDCGRSFDSERGLKIHRSQTHKD